MRLSELLAVSGISDGKEIDDCEITEIVTDSRRASLGCMFVCLSGENSDGHDYVADAMLRGAVAVVIQKGQKASIPEVCPYVNIIECESTRRAAAMLYSAWYGSPAKKLKIIAVTGTNGKTTVTYMLKAIFEAALYRCGLIGTIGCCSGERVIYASPDDPLANMTTPDPCQLYRLLAFMAADKVDYVFIEASSHALELCKLDAIEFDTAIFTNLSPEHLNFHGCMDNYAASKAKLFATARLSIINGDDKYADRMLLPARGAKFLYSAKGNWEDRNTYFYAENVADMGMSGINYTLRSKNTIMKVSCPMPGGFTVDNSLCAAACGLLHGISPSTICCALKSFGGVDGRMERVALPEADGISVFIDYAHTPDALENLLLTVRSSAVKGQRIVVVFGCGGERDRSKRPLMGAIASRLADLAIITSDNSRGEDPNEIMSEIEKGVSSEGCEYKMISDRRKAIEHAVKNSRKGDIILLVGKGHEKYEIDSRGKHYFDEKEIVAEAVKKYCPTKDK